MRNLNLDDLDFSPDPTDPTSDDPAKLSAHKALVQAALGRVDTSQIRRAIAGAVPHVIIITTPSHAWSRALSFEITNSYDNVSAKPVVELKKDGNEWAVEAMLARVQAGTHVVFCTVDPDGMLPGIIKAAADIRLELPAVDGRLVQGAIRQLTGSAPRGLAEADFSSLDFPALQLALRPGSRPKDCLVRLRRFAAGGGLSDTSRQNLGPLLDGLPLGQDISSWAYDVVDQLRDVGAGDLSPDVLRYALLAGDPGTGKTVLAGAIARSAGWAFHSASVGGWFTSSDGNLGGVSKACAAFFDGLLANDCTVGFLDEIDSLPSRAALDPSDLQWWGTLINLVLTQIDRLRSSGKRVFLLSATNFAERLDPALTRSSRIEQRVVVRAPRTEAEILAVFAHYLKDEVDMAELAEVGRFALGATPATVAGWVRAARAAARSAGREITAQDVITAVLPAETRSVEEMEEVALHEAGHVVVARSLGIGVDAVSVVSHGAAGGHTRTALPPYCPNRDEIEDRVTVLLAGRAADMLLGKKGAHAGAAVDLEMASSLVARGICELGLYGTLGHVDAITADVTETVNKELKRLLARAVGLVTTHREAVLQLSAVLVTRRHMKGDEVDAILKPLMETAKPRRGGVASSQQLRGDQSASAADKEKGSSDVRMG